MRLLIAGGGTGGHLYPGIAVAQELLARGGNEVCFAGNLNGFEGKVLPGLGYRLLDIRSGGLIGVGLGAKIKSVGRVAMGFSDAKRAVENFRPDACLGVGGYVSFPVVAWCALKGIPSAIAEQNAKAGLSNRLLGKMVKRVYLGDDGAKREFPSSKTMFTGNPLRGGFSAPVPYRTPKAGEPLRVLVLGGSQGAASLNRIVPEALRELKIPVQVVHQCGRGKEVGLKEAYSSITGVTVTPFIDEMAKAYGWAHLVIARAGALTLAELAAAARPAILVPFPYAAENHQEHNALSAQKRGAAICMAERDLTATKLTTLIEGLMSDHQVLEEMSKSAAHSAKVDAAKAIVDDLAGLCGKKRGHDV